MYACTSSIPASYRHDNNRSGKVKGRTGELFIVMSMEYGVFLTPLADNYESVFCFILSHTHLLHTTTY